MTTAETSTTAQIEAAGRAALDAYESIPYEDDLTDAQVWSRLGVAALAAATPLIAAQVREAVTAEIAAEREGFLPSPNLDRAWIAGWHSAVDHIVARVTRGNDAQR